MARFARTCITRAAAWTAFILVAAAPAPRALAQSPEPIRFGRLAGIANDGRVAFSYQDDIWVVDPDGTNPRRITAHLARDFSPRFSPDGKWIAFTSNRNGNNDVYVVASNGGEPKQLTWHSGNDEALYWTPDGKGVVISTQRGANAWGSPLYVQPIDGSVATPLGMGIARAGMFSQDGAMIAFNRNLPSAWRKEYRGNAAAVISVMNVRSGDIAEITNTDMKQFKTMANTVFPMWGADGMIYYATEHEGPYNLWRIPPRGGAPQQVTHHTEGGVFFPSISPDGKKIVYQNDFDLWTIDVPAGKPKKLTIAMAFDPKENDISILATQSRAEGFSISPAGDYMAVDYHGDIVIVPTEAGVGEKQVVTSSPWRERSEEYSPDGRKLAYVSDESGDQEVWVVDLSTGAKKMLSKHASEKSGLTWAQSSQKLAFTADNRMFEVDVAGGPVRQLAHNEAGGFTIQQYSADGKWLLYSRRDDEQNADVYMYDIAGKREYNVTKSPWTETSAALTPDGRTVVFSSNRDGVTNQLYAVSLAKITEDPNDPLVRERLKRAAGPAGRGGRGGGAPDDATAADLGIHPDTSDIERRAIPLTSGGSGAGQFFLSRDGRTVYYAVGGGGGRGGGQGRGAAAPADNSATGLYSVSIDGRDRRRIAAGTFAGMQPTSDRRTVYFRGQANGGTGGRGGRGNAPEVGFPVERLAIPANGGTPVGGAGGGGAGRAGGARAAGAAAAAGEPVSFTFNVKVDRRKEWQQIFDESYRVMKYRYYDPKMHGRDWTAIKAKYEPLLKYAGTNEDVYDIANAAIGELSSSHTGVTGPSSAPMERTYTTKFLGFELEPGNGKYRVSHVYRGGPADKDWIDIKAGDYVLAVDGQDVKAGDDYWKILSNTENEYIPVKVAKTPDGAGAKTFRIASVDNLTNIKYEEWVENNRDSVEKATGGQIAYVHIRAMDQPSLDRFRDEIDRFWQKKGIIVDIRNNGGGNIDQELLDILERQPYQFWNSRTGARTWGRRPRQAIVGPKVMMINYRSVSDAEVTPAGFRQLALGRLVGNPTSAQVIATGSYALINGGAIRTPGSLVVSWDPTKPNNYGFDLENFGVPPDVWVKNSPADDAKGVDKELKVAIEEAMKMLRNQAPAKTVP
ncbi:MAG: S41 family peptidase [Gemmatimonadales bacterium]